MKLKKLAIKISKVTISFVTVIAMLPVMLKEVNAISGGQTLTTGTYQVTAGTYNGGTGLSGIKINEGATVTLELQGGTYYFNGAHASGATGAGAGIEVPNSATLIIRGSGTIIARGGNAAAGSNGSNGSDANRSDETKGGSGGTGGNGGGGAGAGIGGHGGNGGSTPGSSGSAGGSSGTIYLIGTVNVTAIGGSANSSGGSGGSGGNGSFKEGDTALRDDLGWGGGGAGGGGGSGYGANAFGGGGAGGGAGGNGGKGGFGKDKDTSKAGGGGGGGGAPGQGYAYGSGGAGGKGSGHKGTDGTAGSWNSGGSAGTTAGGKTNNGGAGGGTGGNAANGGSGGILYKSTYNTYSGGTGGGGGLAGGGGTTVRTAYDIRNITIEYTPSSFTYDGTAKTPTSYTYKYGTTTIDSSKFTVSNIKDNVNAGEASLTVTGSEKWGESYITTGSEEKHFTINRADINPTLTLTPVAGSTLTYGDVFYAELKGNTGNGVVTWECTSGNATFEYQDTTYQNSVKVIPTSAKPIVIKATVPETANYNSASVSSSPATTINAKDINNTTMQPLSTEVYTGDEIKPKPVITDVFNGNTVTLVEGTDYTLSYEDNLHAGYNAKVKVTGINNYKGDRTLDFTIERADLSKATITKQPSDVIYNGSPQLSNPTVVYNGHELTEGVHYTIEPTEGVDNTNVSSNGAKASEALIGKGDFAGSILDVKFSVLPDSISESNANIVIVEQPADVVFNGLTQETSEPIIEYRGVRLIRDKDYTLTYDSSTTTEVGTAKIKVTGIGNFKDTRDLTYQITPAVLTITVDPDQGKLYGTKDPDVYTYTYSGDFAGFTPTFVGALTRETGDLLGSYKILQGTLEFDPDDWVNHNYSIKYVSDNFVISQYKAEGVSAYLTGTITDNNWYTSIAQITAPEGFKISLSDSLSADNKWTSYVTYPDGNYSEGTTYYLKRDSDNAISIVKSINYKQDTKNPTGSIIIGNDVWSMFLNKITFNMFFNSPVQADLYGTDSMSGIQSVSYIESEKELTYDELSTIRTEDEFISEGEIYWKESHQATVTTEKGIIYVRIEDMAGNISYLSTDGIVYDTINPETTANYEYDGVWTKKEDVVITGKVSDDLSGLKDRYFTYTIDGHSAQVINPDANGNFTIEHLIDGNYNITIEAMDKAGNSATPVTFRVMKDTVEPKLELIADTATISNKQVITFNPIVGCSGAAKVEIFVPDETGVNGTWQEVPDAFSKGYEATESYVDYTFRVYDNAGAVSDPVTIQFANIDSTIPEVKVWAYEDGNEDATYQEATWTNKGIVVVFRNTQNNMGTSTYQWKLDDGEYQDILAENYVCHIPVMDLEGNHTITMRITSQGGSTSEEKTFVINKDNTAPKATVAVENSISSEILNVITFGTMFNEKQMVDISGEDIESSGVVSGIKKIEYFILQSDKDTILQNYPTTITGIEKLAKGKWQEGSFYTIDPNYTYIVYGKVTDEAGNVGYASSNGLLIDDKGPNIDIQYEYNGIWNHDATIFGSVRDELSGVAHLYYWINDDDKNEFSLTDQQFEIGSFEDGKHEVHFEAKDHLGNTTMLDTVHVWQDDSVPSISVSGTDTTGSSAMVTIDAKHDGPSGLDKVEYKIDDGEWIDITDSYKDGYRAVENGTYTFRATSHAGVSAETTITFTQMFADHMAPVIEAIDSNGKKIENNGWASEAVTIRMHNDPANVKGLKYFYRTSSDDPWTEATATKGVVSLNAGIPGDYHYEFKVGLISGVEESDVVTFDLHIDKTLPEAKISIVDKDTSFWKDFLNTITFNTYFKDGQSFKIDASDKESGVDTIEYFVRKSEENKEMDGNIVLASEIETYVDNRWISGDTGTLDAGYAYIVYVKVVDKAGNIKYISSDGIVVDDIKPDISVSHDSDVWVIDDNEEIAVTVEDSLSGIDLGNGKVSYSINEGTSYTISGLTDDGFVIPANHLEEGRNVVNIVAEDRAGNKIDEYNFVVYKDTTVPTLEVTTEPTSGFVAQNMLSIVPNVGASGVKKVEILFPGENTWIDITDSYQEGYAARLNGIYRVRIHTGTGATVSKEVAVSNIDSLQPIISVIASDSDGNGYLSDTWTTKDVTIFFSNKAGNEGTSTYAYKIGDADTYIEVEPNDRGVASLTINEEGISDVCLKITSRTGVESEEMHFIVKKDVTGPILDIGMIDGFTNQQVVTIEATDSGSGTAPTLAYSFDGGASWTSNRNQEFRTIQTIVVMARDALGNTSSQEVKIQLDTMSPVISDAKQNTNAWATSKYVTASIIDTTDKKGESLISEVNSAFLTAKNPYKNGVITKTTPNATDYTLIKIDDATWKTNEEITDILGLSSEDNYWIVAKDNAGNLSASSLIVDKILVEDDKKNDGSGDNGGGDSNKDDKDPIVNGDKPGDDPFKELPDVDETIKGTTTIKEKVEIYIKYIQTIIDGGTLTENEVRILQQTLDQLEAAKDNPDLLNEIYELLKSGDLSSEEAMDLLRKLDTLLNGESDIIDTSNQDDNLQNVKIVWIIIPVIIAIIVGTLIVIRSRRKYHAKEEELKELAEKGRE